MEAYLRASHPRVTEPTEQQCLCMKRRSVRREKHNVCFTSTGAHGFLGGKDSKGELEAYGVGISLCTSPSPPGATRWCFSVRGVARRWQGTGLTRRARWLVHSLRRLQVPEVCHSHVHHLVRPGVALSRHLLPGWQAARRGDIHRLPPVRSRALTSTAAPGRSRHSRVALSLHCGRQ